MEQQMYQRQQQQIYHQQQHMAAFRHGGHQAPMAGMGMRPGFLPQRMMPGHPPDMPGGTRMPGHPAMEMAGGPRMMGQMIVPGMGPRGPMPGYPGGLVRPPTLSPAMVAAPSRSPQTEWPGVFPGSQYRTASPQYSQAQPHFSNSPTYSSGQGYTGPPTPGTYQNPPSVGQQPSTPGGSYQNPTTPVSYPNPTTPVSYPNPSTPVSVPNPATPVSYPNPTTPNSQHNPLTPQPQDGGSASKAGSNSSVIQQNPLASSATFSSPKSEMEMDPPKSSIPNLFKDGSKMLTPMLSP